MQESIWNRTASLRPREPLSGDRKVDAAVIGGGLAGILTAHFLRAAGLETVVLEAARAGSGQTGRTTAKITAQHGLIYERLIDQLGREKAVLYAQANQWAVAEYRRMVREGGIDCDFTDCPAYLYATGDPWPIHREAEAAHSLGIDAACTADTELPFPVAAALRFGNQARFHPLRFLDAVAEPLELYEQTRVRDVEGNRVITDRGTVTAEHVVSACHYPFRNVPGYYFLRMHQERSYVLALKNAPQLDGMYYGVDPEGLSFRNAGEYLLLGGGNLEARDIVLASPILGSKAGEVTRRLDLRNVQIKGGSWRYLRLLSGQWENVVIEPPVIVDKSRLENVAAYNLQFPQGEPWSEVEESEGPLYFGVTRRPTPFAWEEVHVPEPEDWGIAWRVIGGR